MVTDVAVKIIKITEIREDHKKGIPLLKTPIDVFTGFRADIFVKCVRLTKCGFYARKCGPGIMVSSIFGVFDNSAWFR
jgi:hypothetical protein